MKCFAIRTIALAFFVGLLCAIPANLAAGGEELDKKIKQMRKELDELRAKEKEIAKQQQDLAKALADLEREARLKAEEARRQKDIAQKKLEEADRKNHYVKVELRGKLTNSKNVPGHMVERWFVSTNEVNWPLELDGKNKKELLATATKLLNQPVLVTGSFSTKPRPPGYPMIPPGWPRPVNPGDRWWPGTGQPIQEVPWGIYPPLLDIHQVVLVDSITLVDINQKK